MCAQMQLQILREINLVNFTFALSNGIPSTNMAIGQIQLRP